MQPSDREGRLGVNQHEGRQERYIESERKGRNRDNLTGYPTGGENPVPLCKPFQ